MGAWERGSVGGEGRAAGASLISPCSRLIGRDRGQPSAEARHGHPAPAHRSELHITLSQKKQGQTGEARKGRICAARSALLSVGRVQGATFSLSCSLLLSLLSLFAGACFSGAVLSLSAALPRRPIRRVVGACLCRAHTDTRAAPNTHLPGCGRALPVAAIWRTLCFRQRALRVYLALFYCARPPDWRTPLSCARAPLFCCFPSWL